MQQVIYACVLQVLVAASRSDDDRLAALPDMSGRQDDLVQFGGPGWALDKAVEAIAAVRHASKTDPDQQAHTYTVLLVPKRDTLRQMSCLSSLIG